MYVLYIIDFLKIPPPQNVDISIKKIHSDKLFRLAYMHIKQPREH